MLSESLYNIGNRYLSLFDLINVSKGMIPRFGSIANTPVSNFHSVFLRSFFPNSRSNLPVCGVVIPVTRSRVAPFCSSSPPSGQEEIHPIRPLRGGGNADA